MEALFKVSAGSLSDLAATHRRVVRVGAIVGWSAAVLTLLAGLVAGDARVSQTAAGPALAAALMTAQTLLRKEHAGFALFGSAAVLAITYTMLGVSTAGVPISVALVVVAALGTVLVERNRVATLALTAGTLFALPIAWDVGALPAFEMGLVNAGSYLVTAVVLLTISNAIGRYSLRYKTLFEDSPAAMLEEDWTESVDYLRDEYDGKPERVEAFLLAYPSVIRNAVDKARVVRANRACVDLLEAGSEEVLVGYRDGSRVSEVNHEAWAAILGALYRGETSFGIDMATVTRRGRPIWVQVKGADTDPDRPASSILVGLADVTHNRERSDAMAELVRAKNDFIAKVSHELRTPLTAVVGLASELADQEDMDQDDRDELTRLVAAQAAEVAAIVEDLLVAARAELGSMTVDAKVVDLGAELAATVEGLGLDVADLPEAVPPVVADPGRVRQVLRNLLTNARRYGGPVVRVLAGGDQGRVWLEVRDDGPGVAEEQAERIFEPYTGKRSGESVGIGLSVSRQLAEMMRGSLTYRRDGDETVFRLELPAATVIARRTLASQAVDA